VRAPAPTPNLSRERAVCIRSGIQIFGYSHGPHRRRMACIYFGSASLMTNIRGMRAAGFEQEEGVCRLLIPAA